MQNFGCLFFSKVIIFVSSMKFSHIYIHFPFCLSKCPYCDFYSVSGLNKDAFSDYISRLISEIGLYRGMTSNKVKSLYFGGGTPSLLTSEEIEKIMQMFSFDEDAEITVEVNPATADEDKLKAFFKTGINRISLGVQSFINRDLRVLGRKHSAEDVYRTFRILRSAGYDNISIDLMIAVPGQTPASIIYNAMETALLDPEHVSVYILTYYEETLFYKMLESGRIAKTDDDVECEYFDLMSEILCRKGYHRYEVSNFSKSGMNSQHNLNVWNFGNYLGFGPSAYSCKSGIRKKNPDELVEYLRNIDEGRIHNFRPSGENSAETKKDFIMLGMRKTEGVDVREYKKTFGTSIYDDYGGKIKELILKGLITADDRFLKVRENRMNILNSILCEII